MLQGGARARALHRSGARAARIPLLRVLSRCAGLGHGIPGLLQDLGARARAATAEQVKNAYRRLARKYHPDVSKEKNAEESFKEVQEAYEVLKDAEKRAAYDQLGSEWKSGQQFRPPPDWGSGFEFSRRPERGRPPSAQPPCGRCGRSEHAPRGLQ